MTTESKCGNCRKWERAPLPHIPQTFGYCHSSRNTKLNVDGTGFIFAVTPEHGLCGAHRLRSESGQKIGKAKRESK